MRPIGKRRTRDIPQDQSLVISPVKVDGVQHFGDFGGLIRADYLSPYSAGGMNNLLQYSLAGFQRFNEHE